jgi:phospholipase C
MTGQLAADGMTSRRRLLQAGLVVGAAGATGWALAPASGTAATHLRRPGSLPYPHLPVGTDTIPQIRHIVVLMLENHSYDNIFGMLRRHGADGFRLGRNGKPRATNPYRNGDLQHAFRMPTTCQLHGKPSQNWLNSHIQFAKGRNDGFVKSGSGPVAMGYWKGVDQPFYYSIGHTFPIADRYFCSVLGQTFPNRRYLISGTSIGMVNDTLPKSTDYPANGTIFDRLDAAKVSWRDYYTTLASTLLYPKLYTANLGRKVIKVKHFFADAAAGKLPGFCLVEPNYVTQSEENPQDIVRGEQFAAKVIDAVMKGPGWKHTLVIFTFDEHGGYFDHVPPPRALAPDHIPPHPPHGQSTYNGFRQYGFRVPCAVISPWARPHYVSHRVFDHTSIIALVSAKWNLPALTFRDANANPMLDMLDLRHPAFLHPPRLAKPRVVTDPHSLACLKTGPGTIPPPGSITRHHAG